MTPLAYYFVKKGVLEHVIFNNYTIENGIIHGNLRNLFVC